MSAATLIVNKYIELVHSCGDNIDQVGKFIPIPLFSESILKKLCEESKKVNVQVFPVTPIHLDIVVVGDLHGNLHNLLEIFRKFGDPPRTKYLFIGNIIDYGDFSLECLALLLALNTLYPTDVYVLRGHTENHAISVYHGLETDVKGAYMNTMVYDAFIDAIHHLPIAAIVNGKIFCSQPEVVKRYSCVQEMVEKNENVPILRQEAAYNDTLQTFGKVDYMSAVYFAESSDLELMILGSCPDEMFYDFNSGVLSLSSCNQCAGAVVKIIEGEESQIEMFESNHSLERIKANFIKVSCPHGCKDVKYIIPTAGSKKTLKKVITPEIRNLAAKKSLPYINSMTFLI